MALSAGIIGLPNVGKSTLFNAITKLQVEAANYPFATIKPNVGIVNVPDKRLDALAKLYNSSSVINAKFQFIDIAGLVKGASKGEGLGNQFLENIKNVDTICHVVRCFDDPKITHVNSEINPLADIKIINLELILKDISSVESALKRISKKNKTISDKSSKEIISVYEKVLKILGEEKLLNNLELTKDEQKILKPLNLITIKKVIYIANILEDSLSNPEQEKHYLDVKKFAIKNNSLCLFVSAKIEQELSLLPQEERLSFMKELGMEISGLDNLIKTSYELLSLKTYFTAGPKEVRAWTFVDGNNAVECAGIIHNDFARGFIRAEVMKYSDLIFLKSEAAVKEKGKWYSEGKNYLVQDGDVILFRFNV